MDLNQTMLPIEYLCIDIANHYGLDKSVYAERIQWVKDNVDLLESFTEQADEPLLFTQAVKALREVQAGKPSGHMVALDATCSGAQLLSVMMNCRNGCRITNCLNEDKRYDAYTEVTNRMNILLGANDIEVSRKDAKEAVMTSLYGATRKPKEIFGDLYDVFDEALFVEMQGAYEGLQLMRNAWQPHALEHYWVMPDLHEVLIRVLEKKETRIAVDELGGHRFTTNYTVNVGAETGISLPANITHSVDSYILRSLIRRCSYSRTKIAKAITVLEEASNEAVQATNEDIIDIIHIYNKCGMVDISWINYINTTEEVVQLPESLRIELLRVMKDIVVLPRFDVVTIHDAYLTLPQYANALRYVYKELLAELAASSMLQGILWQITGTKVRLGPRDLNLPNDIRQAIYPIC